MQRPSRSRLQPQPSRPASRSSTMQPRRLIACASLSILALTSSCASQPPAPQILVQRVSPPAELLDPRPMPSWPGGDYGALGAYAATLQAWGLKAEADKAAVRDFVQR